MPSAEQTSETFDQQEVLKSAGLAVEDLFADDDFLDTCMDAHIDARIGHAEFAPREFWPFAAGYVRRQAEAAGDEDHRSVESLAIELSIATPAYVLDVQMGHNPQRNTLLTPDETRAATERIGYYHALLHRIAEVEPRMSVKRLGDHLGKLASNMLMQPESVQPSAFSIAHMAMRGMQSELTFEHAMRATGREVQHTTLQQDLAGVDYYFVAKSGAMIPVDVKASTDRLDAMRGESTSLHQLFAIDWQRRRVLISSLTGGRGGYSDTFFLGDDQSLLLGNALAESLDRAAYQLAHPEVFRAIS